MTYPTDFPQVLRDEIWLRAVSVPSSALPPDLAAELDTLAVGLVAAIPRGTPQSDEAKAKLRIRI